MASSDETGGGNGPAAARRGVMLVLSSPSGAGKTTLSRALLAADPAIKLSVSVTTRTPRPGEVDGRDYHFRSEPEFQHLVAEGALLEWASVHGNHYGTPKASVMERLRDGGDILFDIDWQGAAQLFAQAPHDVVRIFILPPSAATLAERLRRRAQDGPEVVARRLAGAAAEIARWNDYDYVLVNADVDRCLAEIRAILAAERLRRTRQNSIAGLVESLLRDL
jgi:guanylate kinase